MSDFAETLLATNLSPEERLINAFRLHIGDDDPDEGYEYHAEELYLFLNDGNKFLQALNIATNLTFSDTAISIAGTITDQLAIALIFAADYMLWRRLEREGTRRAVNIREMDTAIDTRQIARSATEGLRMRWQNLMEIVKEMRRGSIQPYRINTYVTRNFPASDQSGVDETRGDSTERI